MAVLLDQLIQVFDIVLVDTPSLLAVADAAVLAPLASGVAVVVGLAQARQEAVETALKQLDDVKVKPVGVIVNRAEQSGRYYPREHPGEEVDRYGSRTKLSSSLGGRLALAVQRLSSLLKSKPK